MKVLWVFNHPAPYKVDFFNELGKKCDLTVFFERSNESDRNPQFYYEKAKNFSCHVLKSLKLGAANNYTGVAKKEIKEHSYDVIVMNGYSTFTEMKAIKYLHKKKMPYIFAINGGIVRKSESGLRRYLKHKFISDAAMYLAPDPKSAEYLKYYGADEKKIKLYPYSTVFAKEVLPEPLTENERAALRKELDIDGERLYLAVGQFIERKNNTELLAIWKDMPKNYHLMIVGNGPEKPAYEKYIRDNSLSNVTIMDYEPHQRVLGLFKLADYSLFLTKEDIYGHVVNESMSQGTPVIASTHSNSALNLIESGKNGFLVDLDKPEEVAKALQNESSMTMRTAAIATAKANTIETMAERHYALFEEMLRK